MTRLLRQRYHQFRFYETPKPLGVTQRLRAYLGGKLNAIDSIQVDPGGTAFQQKVWAALRTIPPGTTRTYRDVAEQIGRPNAWRAVGRANALNPISIVPALPSSHWCQRRAHRLCRGAGTQALAASARRGMSMKIFVTGATGVIGRRVVPQLIRAGHQVTGLARTDRKEALLRQFGATPVRVDLFDPATLTPVLTGHEAVANLVTNVPPLGQALEPTAWEMHDRLRNEASRSVTRAAAEAGCRIFIQESITFPYADKGAEWIEETDADNCPPEMASSRVAEEQAAWFSENGGQGIVLRFALFYAHDSSHTQEFQAAIRAGPVSVSRRPRQLYEPYSCRGCRCGRCGRAQRAGRNL